MADFFSDIKNDFDNAINNMDLKGINSIIDKYDELLSKGKELSKTFNDSWSRNIAPSKDQIALIDKTVENLHALIDAENKAQNAMHDIYASGNGNAMQPQILALQKLIDNLRELRSTAQSVVEKGRDLKELIPKTNATQINIGNEKSKGEILPVEQVKQQAEQIITVTQEASEKAQRSFKVWSKELGRYVEQPITKDAFKESFKNDEKIKSEMKEERRQKDEDYWSKGRGNSTDNYKKQLEESIKEKEAILAQKQAEYGRKQAEAPFVGTKSFMAFNKEKGQYEQREINVRSDKDQRELDEKRTEIEKLQKELQEQKEQLANLPTQSVNGSSQSLGNVADATSKIGNQSNKTTSSLKNLDRELKQKKTDADSASGGMQRFAEVMRTAISTIGHIAKTINGVWNGIKTGIKAIEGFANGIKNAISHVKSFASSIISLASGAFNGLKSAVSTTLGNFKSLVTGGFNLVQKGANALKSGLQSIKSTMHSLVKKGTPNLMKSFSSLKSMLMRRIKRTFISSIFNQAKEGLQQLAKHSAEFNKSMSNIKNTAKQVSGNLAVTLGNLIQTIEPVLMTLLNWFNKVFEAVNSLFALLSGKKTITVAKKGTDDYAKSLNKASNSAKDLNHQLYGFDEITRQEDNKNSGSGSGKIEYEEKAIDTFYDDIIKMFKSGKFREIGRLIGNGLSDILKKVDTWLVEIRPKATEWARNLAEILNGIVDTDVFNSLGKTLGDGLNLVADVIYNFLDQFDFNALGVKLASGLNTLFDTIDWGLIGKTVGKYFSSIWQTIYNFFGTLKWGEIGRKLASGVQSLFDNLDWESYKGMWIKGVNGVTELAWNFITNVKWEEITKQFVDNVTGIVNGIKWTDADGTPSLAGTVSAGIDSILKCFGELVKSDFFKVIAAKLGLFVGAILNRVNFTMLAEYASTGLGKIREAFWTFITKLNLPSLGTRLAEAINGLVTNKEVKDAWDSSDNAVINGIDDIITAFDNFVTDIDFDGIMRNLANRIENLFNRVRWGKLGSAVHTGLTKAVVGFTGFIKRVDFPNIAQKLGSALSEVFASDKNGNSIFTAATGLIKTGVEELVKAFGVLIDEIFKKDENGKTIGDKIADGFNKLFEKGENQEGLFGTIGKTIGGAIVNILENINDFLTGINWESVKASLSEFFKAVPWTDILVRIITFAKNVLVDAIKLVGGLTQAICDAIGTLDWKQIAGAVFNFLFEGILNLIKEGGQLVEKVFSMLFGGKNEFEKALNEEYGKRTEGIFGIEYSYELITDKGKDKRREWVNKLKEQIEAEKQEAIKQATAEIEAETGEKSDGSIEAEIALEYDAVIKDVDTAFQEEALELSREQFSIYASGWLASHGITVNIPLEEIPDVSVGPIPNWELIKEQFGLHGIELSDEFIEQLSGKGQDDIKRCLDLIGRGVNQEVLTAFDVAGISEKLDNWMKESGMNLEETAVLIAAMGGQDVSEMAKALGVDVGNVLGKIIPESMSEALNVGEKEVEEAKKNLTQAAKVSTSEIQEGIDQSTKLGSASAGALASSTLGGKKEVTDSTKEVTSAVQAEYEKLPDDVKPYAEQMMTYIATAFAEGDGTVRAAAESVANNAVARVKEILNGPTGIQIAKTFLDGIWAGINQNSTSVINRMGYIAKETRDKANLYVNAGNGKTIGSNLLIGMINGFNSWSDMLVQTIAKICRTTVYKARDILGIKSPSKVFQEIGEYTMEGMQIGLEHQGKDVICTVSDIASSIIDAGEDVDFGDSIGNSLDNVASKLERIANIFADMADTIASMGGLEIPTIASGRTIPYATQIEQSKFGGGTQLGGESIEDALYSAFTRAMSGSSGEQSINITLQIDGRKMADIVSKYQRQQGRAWGV